MSSKENNLRNVSEEEINQFTAGVYSAFGVEFNEKEFNYVNAVDLLLDEEINILGYPTKYSSSSYVKKVEKMFGEIFYQIKMYDQKLPINKKAYIKGFLLGVLVRSNQVQENYCYLQDNLDKIESLETSKAIIAEDWYYKTENDGWDKEIALAYLDGQLDLTKEFSLEPKKARKIYADIEVINNLMSEVHQLCNGTHVMYKK